MRILFVMLTLVIGAGLVGCADRSVYIVSLGDQVPPDVRYDE